MALNLEPMESLRQGLGIELMSSRKIRKQGHIAGLNWYTKTMDVQVGSGALKREDKGEVAK
jgi:hypothetical protein